MKKDKYLRERGGTAKIIDVACTKCGNILLVYQKDGPGWLKRCYLNRILSSSIPLSSSTENLVCSCGQILGSLSKHKDGRQAFFLIRSKFKRLNNKR